MNPIITESPTNTESLKNWSASFEKTIGLNIRPNYRETISKIKEKYHVIMFTASLQKYADAIMEEIDPNGELFQYRLYRNNCTQIKVDNQIYYIKDVRVFKNTIHILFFVIKYKAIV